MINLIPFNNNHINHQFNKLTDNLRSSISNELNNFNDFGFRTDIKELPDNYLLQAELPGVSKEDIDLKINNDYLTISAVHQDVIKKETKKENYIIKERRTGRFQRNFHLQNIKRDQISAKYDNGLLEITLPKNKPDIPQSQEIPIN